MSGLVPEAPLQVLRDPSTDLGNMLAFLTRLDRALARVVEQSVPLAVLMLDLDRFSDLNDRIGRDAGDEAIRRVATALKEVACHLAEDTAAAAFRLGGDEFALLVPGADVSMARAIAAQLLAHEALVDLSLSIGISLGLPGDGELGRVLLDADGALRAAKAQGGRRIVLYHNQPLDEASANLLVGRLVRRATELGRWLEEAYRLALSDPVTGLPNQRALYAFLEAEIPRATRHGHSFALLLIDGDNLKAYNETLGYTAGDAWIRALGNLLMRETRASDVVVRWRSGDEFIVALPETDRHAAHLMAERIRRAAQLLSDQLPLPVTVSIGIAAFPDDATTIDELLSRVADANQQAKQGGKNQVAFPPHLVTASD